MSASSSGHGLHCGCEDCLSRLSARKGPALLYTAVFEGGALSASKVMRLAGSVPCAYIAATDVIEVYAKHGLIVLRAGDSITKGADGDVYRTGQGLQSSRAS